MDSMSAPVWTRIEVSGARALGLRWPLKLNDFGHFSVQKLITNTKTCTTFGRLELQKSVTHGIMMQNDKFGVRMSTVDLLLTHQFSTLPCGLE